MQMQTESIMKLPVNSLETSSRVRVRKQAPKESGDVVLDYAEAYKCGLIVEPLEVFQEPGTERYLIADGEHRLLGLVKAKIKEVEVRLHKGDEIAALDFALGCNHAHGLPRTKADKYHAFCMIAETPELSEKYRTDSEKSEKIGVSKRTISSYGAEWRESQSSNQSVRRAKSAAKSSAQKKTNNRAETKLDDADCIIPNQRKSKVKAQGARSRGNPEWTTEDEQTFKVLKRAWDAATTAAQWKFKLEVS